LQTHGILCATASDRSVQNLDNVLIRFRPLWERADALLASSSTTLDDLRQIKHDAMALDKEYAEWPSSQPEDFKPRTVGHVSQRQDVLVPDTGYWPGRIDVYFDRKSDCNTALPAVVDDVSICRRSLEQLPQSSTHDHRPDSQFVKTA
jgi:hypothetical protein